MTANSTLESGLLTGVTFGHYSTGLAVVKNPPDLSKQISFRYFGISIAVYAIVVGGIGNLFTILAFAANRKLRTTFNVFIVNLSVVDFATAVFMLPFNLAGYVQMEWPFGNASVTTRMQAFSYFSCGYTSVVFLVAITVNRFVGVVKPGRYNELFGRTRIYFVLLFCWLFAPVCLFPFLVGSDPSCKTPGSALTGFNKHQFLCTFVCLPRNGWDSYMQITRVTFQFLPLAIMVALYGYIFATMKRKSKKIVKRMTKSRIAPSLRSTLAVGTMNPSSRSNSVSGMAASGGRNKSCDGRRLSENSRKSLFLRKMSSQSITTSRRAKNENRMLFISVAICVGFMITFLPSVVVNLLPGRRSFDPRVHMMASNFSWFNSSINPVIYVIMNRRFRREYWRLVKMLFGQVKGGFVRDVSSSLPEKGQAQRSHSISGNASSQLLVNQNGKAPDSPIVAARADVNK